MAGVVVRADSHAQRLARPGARVRQHSQRSLAAARLLVEQAVEPEQASAAAQLGARVGGADLRSAVVDFVEPAVIPGVRVDADLRDEELTRCRTGAAGAPPVVAQPVTEALMLQERYECRERRARGDLAGPPAYAHPRSAGLGGTEVAGRARRQQDVHLRLPVSCGRACPCAPLPVHVEHHPVGAAHEVLVAISRSVERLRVEHVAPWLECSWHQV